ncbi:hypothetical protein CEXT_354591 [Caerostris extrusa]|uniref:Uncharacterized protein n=1 Tax=Caerostris extrusa TaxID=172846 RepID=A0AAV4RCT1_CAEEX|nr:hypothetical protein CEXT_354591 [Caerostris extrusa]
MASRFSNALNDIIHFLKALEPFCEHDPDECWTRMFGNAQTCLVEIFLIYLKKKKKVPFSLIPGPSIFPLLVSIFVISVGSQLHFDKNPDLVIRNKENCFSSPLTGYLSTYGSQRPISAVCFLPLLIDRFFFFINRFKAPLRAAADARVFVT